MIVYVYLVCASVVMFLEVGPAVMTVAALLCIALVDFMSILGA